ncbi:MAG: glucose-1-phosphate thymidylyltransferase RfbA [bacterium]|nr:glucose-1-phosphate thymidylyltransferase RfbA [bacterium]
MDKGIILAGGSGTRLYPLSRVASKQLQAIYDKPMVYYPLSTLMLAGIRRLCVISTPHDLPRFEDLMGDGRQWGIELTYRAQPEPRGIAQAFLIAEDFIAGDPVCLILGDNLFYGRSEISNYCRGFSSGGLIFAYRVRDPERYGVVEFDRDGRVLSIEEKPRQPRSSYAIPGIYLFDGQVTEICRGLRPSARGELEITDVQKVYLSHNQLRVAPLGRGTAWLDTGTTSALQEASNFVAILEKRQGSKVGCPEEVAARMGFIGLDQFDALVAAMPDCEYSAYLKDIGQEMRHVRPAPPTGAGPV